MRALWDALLFLVWVSTFLGLAWRIGRYRRDRLKGSLCGGAYSAREDLPFQVAMLLLAVALGLGTYLVSRLVTSLLGL